MTRKKPQPPPDSTTYQNTTEFRILERTCKRKGPIDHILLSLDNCSSFELEIFDTKKQCYTFQDFPGFYLVKDAIPIDVQKRVIQEALEDWTKPPNVSNLDSHWHLEPKGLWNQYVSWKRSGEDEPLIRKRVFEHETEMYQEKDCENPAEKTIFTVDSELKLVIDKPTDPMAKNKDEKLLKVLPRLRWITLGHQYNWTKKEYHFDRVPAFPPLMVDLCLHIITSFEPIIHYKPQNWKPEAGIVNFYQPGDSLMAHQDKSEPNPNAPLISMSLGLDCVFLIGTDDRKDKPIALKLSSGDLVLMYGQARRAFHGVPRVLENTCPEYLQTNEPEWQNFKEYISHTRMNVNIRQVF